jgi:hypothetical protein
MIIELKQKHINQGEPFDPCNCAIARAVKESLGIDAEADSFDSDRVIVSDAVEVFFSGNLVMKFALPKKAVQLMARYDDKGKKAVKPTTLRLTERIP